MRRYLEALAQSHVHLFDVLVRLASGPLLARRDAFLDKCALDSSMMASLSVQPLKSSTLFGPKIPEVSKCYREDLTRKSLQRATSQSLPKIKKKTGAKSEKIKLVVNSSESGQRQVVSQPVASTQASLQGSSLLKRLKNLRERRTRVNKRA